MFWAAVDVSKQAIKRITKTFPAVTSCLINVHIVDAKEKLFLQVSCAHINRDETFIINICYTNNKALSDVASPWNIMIYLFYTWIILTCGAM